MYPTAEPFDENSMAVVTRPIFMRLREVHGVYGDSACGHAFRCSCPVPSSSQGEGIGVGTGAGGAGNGGGGVFDDGMSNAWFPGPTGSVGVRDLSNYHSFGNETDAGERVQVTVENGRVASAVYRLWEGGGKRPPDAGNATAEASSSENQPHENEEGEGEGEGEGYPHPPHQCPVCVEQEGLRASLKREETEEEDEARERLFADVGLGLSGSPGGGSSRDEGDEEDEGEEEEELATRSAGSLSPALSGLDLGNTDTDSGSPSPSAVEDDDDDEEEDEEDEDSEAGVWDRNRETISAVGVDGRVFPAAPPAHDKRKLAMAKCDGVREVLLFGEVGFTFFRHSLSNDDADV
jgi:hypothetical protein